MKNKYELPLTGIVKVSGEALNASESFNFIAEQFSHIFRLEMLESKYQFKKKKQYDIK